MYVIRFLGIIAVTVSANCYADYSITIGFRDGSSQYNAPASIPSLSIGQETTIASGKEFDYKSGSTDYPNNGSWWGCWGAKSNDGQDTVLDSTTEGYIKSGNDDYVFIFGNTHFGNARCKPGQTWFSSKPGFDYYVSGQYLKLKRIANTGDATPLIYPRIFICLMPSDRSGSYESKCNTYSSEKNNSAWDPNRTTVIPPIPPSACTARVTVNGSPVMDGGTIQLETISTYGTIGVPPSTLYTGKSFAIEPVNGPGENCQDFKTSKVTFRYDEVLSQGVPVVRSNSPDVGFVIKRNDTRDYVENGTQMSFSDLEPEFKVNYWSLTPTAGAGAFSSGTVTIDIIYN
ncbi:hypothetical protein FLL96_12195 [Vibrio cholerae]|uniref:Fimbrial protein n=1 Tax=Vibrio cholerae TaxID=666 RepID=A0A544MU74_VIBCL|nr:hypothetical protein [Vibrio cholerae]MCD6670746.1 hypothetical protein [Vibrio cholerae]TQO65864.1 hypothetical protein FLM08_09685 [Vibrio cholerae]TQP11647.1 hypothetical protein FLL96_12195 [Vibrio cholerae]TQP12011.1 hypothetical protein FLM02_13805 [Vibrio cholerae]TQP31726.1 hypothetical protein FLL93_14630 [Vibrio cholerae]